MLTKVLNLEEEHRLRRDRYNLLGLKSETDTTTEEKAELESLPQKLFELSDNIGKAKKEEERDLELRAGQVTGDGETNEKIELRQKAQRVNYFTSALEQRAVNGVELELNQAYGIAPHRFPMFMLNGPEEARAKQNIDTSVSPMLWVDPLFAVSSAKRVGVTFVPVAPGTHSIPIVTAVPTATQKGREETTAAGTLTTEAKEVKPTRLPIHTVVGSEDEIRNPGLMDTHVRNIRAGVQDALDAAIFKGDSGANEAGARIVGLQTAPDVVERTITQLNKIKGKESLEEFVALIDGKHAEGAQDLNIIASVGANTLWMSTLINSTVDSETLAQFLQRSGLSWSVRADIDTATASGDFGAYIGRARGIMGAAVAAIWSDGLLTVDPYSGAEAGTVKLVLTTLWAFAIPRPTNFARLKFT